MHGVAICHCIALCLPEIGRFDVRTVEVVGLGEAEGRCAVCSVQSAECPVTPVCPVSVYKPNAKAQSPGALSTGLRCRSRPAPSRSAARAPPAPSICGAALELWESLSAESRVRAGETEQSKRGAGGLWAAGDAARASGGAPHRVPAQIYILYGYLGAAVAVRPSGCQRTLFT